MGWINSINFCFSFASIKFIYQDLVRETKILSFQELLKIEKMINSLYLVLRLFLFLEIFFSSRRIFHFRFSFLYDWRRIDYFKPKYIFLEGFWNRYSYSISQDFVIVMNCIDCVFLSISHFWDGYWLLFLEFVENTISLGCIKEILANCWKKFNTEFLYNLLFIILLFFYIYLSNSQENFPFFSLLFSIINFLFCHILRIFNAFGHDRTQTICITFFFSTYSMEI